MEEKHHSVCRMGLCFMELFDGSLAWQKLARLHGQAYSELGVLRDENRFTKLKFPGTLNDFQYWTERVTIHGLIERPKSGKNNPVADCWK